MAFGDTVANTVTQGDMPRFAWLGLDLDERERALAVVDACDSPEWKQLGRAILTGDHAAAVAVLARMGGVPSELAYVQLRAGGKYAREALTFYESANAPAYARRALSAVESSA
jgi:hypothetical protein